MIKEGTVLFDLSSMGELVKGRFLKRENRFIGIVDVDGGIYNCHIADTGRLKEILTENREVLLSKNPDHLKTDFKLLACKMEHWALINTSIHSKIARSAIQKGVLGFIPADVKSEIKVGNSRLDFLVDDMFIELKGSNLLIENRCVFPDAPTKRGVKHIKELIAIAEKGGKAGILIMALRDCNCFRPHLEMDRDFAFFFKTAIEKGVKFFSFKVRVEETTVIYIGNLNLCEGK